MATKGDLRNWVVDALTELGGTGSVVEVCREVWRAHESELSESGDFFYTWQYDIRWAAQELRGDGTLAPSDAKVRSWSLAGNRRA